MTPAFAVGDNVQLQVAHNRGVSWRSGVVRAVTRSGIDQEARFDVEVAPGALFRSCHPDSLRLAAELAA